jgi:hypothetical protein
MIRPLGFGQARRPFLLKNVIGDGDLELNKVRHKPKSAQALHQFSKRSLQKKLIDRK